MLTFVPTWTIEIIGFNDLQENETVWSLRCDGVGSLTSFYETTISMSKIAS